MLLLDEPASRGSRSSTGRRALENTAGNKVRAAALLRISQKKVYAKIAKYGL